MFDEETPEEKLLASIRGARGAGPLKGGARLRSLLGAWIAKAVAASDRTAVAVAVIVLVGACGTIVRAFRATPPQPAVSAAAAAPTAQSLPLAEYQKGVRSHDLFGVSPQSDAVQVQADLAGLQLQGVITAEPRQAILKDAKTDTTLFVAVGDVVSDYTVKSIEDGKVTMINGEDRLELKM